MGIALLTAFVLLAPVQPGTQFAGTWIAEHSGATFVRLELRAANGSPTGELALGDVQVDAKGVVSKASPAPSAGVAIFDVVVKGSTMTFARSDGNDIDRFEATRIGEELELRFIVTEEFRKELAAEGIAEPKPVRLHRVAK
jgi:hypothetical protein